jgi:hypothetical protein
VTSAPDSASVIAAVIPASPPPITAILAFIGSSGLGP